MKKLDFDWRKASKPLQPDIEKRAQEILKRYRDEYLSHPDIQGVWIGSKYGEPYIMILVKPGSKLIKTIPDELERLKVYYLEGMSTLMN